MNDKRLIFISKTVNEIKDRLQKSGSDLLVFRGDPSDVFSRLFSFFDIAAVYAGVDYEPRSLERDGQILDLCRKRGVLFHGFHDHVILAPDRVVKSDGTPYQVFTPYRNRWLEIYHEESPESFPSAEKIHRFFSRETLEIPDLPEVGLYQGDVEFPSAIFNRDIIRNYHETRDFPALEGTTRLGIHLRFGTVSIRRLAVLAEELNPVFLNELIWREFYQMVLFFHPHVVSLSFKPGYDRVRWLNRPEDFEAWCEGRTGYPLVDAGMRQLVSTGFMHNRIRMLTASFLTKHLLVDWRMGEAFFGLHLLDYELASNNGGWQWAAGSGCDAAPYFRVFSPERQQKRYDPQETYIRRWLPEYASAGSYPHKRIVEHEFARSRAIAHLKEAERR